MKNLRIANVNAKLNQISAAVLALRASGLYANSIFSGDSLIVVIDDDKNIVDLNGDRVFGDLASLLKKIYSFMPATAACAS